MITDSDITIISTVYSWIAVKARGKYRASMRFDGMDNVRIVLTDANYNPVFSHEWQHGDSAASFAHSLQLRLNETGILN